jgi:hypothetical protein
MKLKISIFNKILAILLSTLFFITSIISFFSLPLEMIFFNVDNVFLSLEDEKTQALVPAIVGELTGDVFYQSYPNGKIPTILKDEEEFKILISEYIPTDWASQIIHDFIEYSYEFINFKATESSLKLDISTLKRSIIENSQNISEDIINSKHTCPANQVDTEMDIYELPNCRPDATSLKMMIQILEGHINNQFKKIPSKITIDYVFFWNEKGFENLFTSYNVIRWVIRLMPLVSIGLLILLSILLRKNRRLMLRWFGGLLTQSALVSLLGLIIFSIGFNQFTSITISKRIPGLIPGFDNLLLRIIQTVGYKTLTWTIAVSIFTLVFGLLILAISRVFKKDSLKKVEEEIQKIPGKEVSPETLEEIEEQETIKKDE